MRALVVAIIVLLALPAVAQTPPSPSEIRAYTGLHAAAAAGEVPEIQRLVTARRDINGRDANGRTPLMVAAFQEQDTAARALIAAGADHAALDNDKYDAVTIAAVAGDKSMLDLLLGAGASAKLMTSPYDGTALIASADRGHVEIVRALLRAKAPLDHINNLGWTALIEAIVLGDGGARHQTIVRDLIAAGADVNIADRNGLTPLGLARRRGYREMMEMLVAAGGK